MFIILIGAVVVLAVVGFILWSVGYNKKVDSNNHLTEFDKINSIEDPLLRQVAINDWLNKRV